MFDDSGPPQDSPPPGPVSESQAISAIAEELEDMGENSDFSGAVLLAKRGKTIVSKAFGVASRESSVPNRLDTKFNLESINKIFTKVAAALLLERGKLSLDDTLGKFIPVYSNREAKRKVTVRNLIDMSSGIGNILGERFDATPKIRLRRNEDFLQFFSDEHLAFEPGTERLYSNGGYVVLGLIVERVSGLNYYDYVREHIFGPSGMTNTDSYEADAVVADIACGYTHIGPDGEEGPLRSNIYTRPARGSAAGGGYSTASDLLRFTLALESNRLLSPEYSDCMLGGPEPGESDGDTEDRAAHAFAFAGGAPGINSVIEAGLPGGYDVIVMSNLDPPSAMKAAGVIRRWLAWIE